MSIMQSSCVPCVACTYCIGILDKKTSSEEGNQSVYVVKYAGFSKCQRCTNEGVPHKPSTDFKATISVLVKHGLRYTERMEFILNNFSRNMAQRLSHSSRLLFILKSESKAAVSGKLLYTPAAPAAAAAAAASSASAPASSSDATEKGVLKIRTCASCGKGSEKMSKCSGCARVYYCNRECQLVHWKMRKKNCKLLATSYQGFLFFSVTRCKYTLGKVCLSKVVVMLCSDAWVTEQVKFKSNSKQGPNPIQDGLLEQVS